MQTTTAREQRRGDAYRNGVLTVIAVALVAVVAQGTVGVPGPSEAQAQRDRRVVVDAPGGLNPADDRRVMTEELRGVNERLDRILAAIGRQPFDVNVLRMPKEETARAGDGDSPE